MRYMTYFLLAASILLAGCVDQPTKVVMPSPGAHVGCVKDVPRTPDWCYDALPVGASDVNQVRCLLIDRRYARPYIAGLEAVIEGCR